MPEDIGYAVAGVALVVFASWLLYLSPRQRATRGLAALLLSIGFLWMESLLWELASPAQALILSRLTATALVCIGLSAFYFLSVYPRPRGWIGASPVGGWVVLGAGVAAALLFALRPSLYVHLEIRDGAVAFVDNGPLFLVSGLWTAAISVMLVLFAIDAIRTPVGPLRRALLLVLAGFLVSNLTWGLLLTFNDFGGRLAKTAIDSSYSRAAYVIDEVAAVPALVAAAIVVVHGLRSPHPTARREAGWLAALVGVAIAGAAFTTFAFSPPEPEEWSSQPQGFADAAAGLSIAVFAGYALLKHRLFDIDVKLRWTLSRGAVAAVFLAVFFVGAQLAQNFLSESYGWMMGGLIAGVMLFAITPIQRVAERVALAAVPASPAGPADGRAKRVEVYRLALEVALADRDISRAEERHLARLAEELGLTHSEALAVREEMERRAGLEPAADPAPA